MSLLQTTSTPLAADTSALAPLAYKEDDFPVPVYQFVVEIDDVVVALFQKVSGMEVTREVEPLTVGGENNFGREFPGHVSYGHITLEAGLSSTDFFWKWMTRGDLDGNVLAKNVTVIQRRPQPSPDSASDEEKIFQVIKTWNFENAFPVSWKIEDLDLSDSEKIVIESLELSFDKFTLG